MVDRVGRVFAAVPLPGEVRAALAHRLEEEQIPGRVAPPENWHITIRFLGSLDRLAYERFLAGLEDRELGAGFRIRLGGVGAFPRPAKATVVWVGVEDGGDRLAELAERTDDAARSAGIPGEDRPFTAHLTLSRVRPPTDVRGLVERVPMVGLSWVCRELVVYRSHLGRGGARYEPLETFPLIR